MSRKILNPFCSVDQSSIPSMKYGDRMGCPLREHLKNIMQRISLNLNSEFCHDENGFQDLAEQVPRYDFVSNVEICRNSRLGTVSKRGWNQSLCLSFFFFLLSSHFLLLYYFIDSANSFFHFHLLCFSAESDAAGRGGTEFYPHARQYVLPGWKARCGCGFPDSSRYR